VKYYLSVFTLAAAFAIAQIASAATQTANFTVTANVGTTCTIAVPAALAFGNYDPTSAAALNGVTTMNVTCTAATPATIDINEGSHAAGGSTPDAPARQMSDGAGQFLTYTLYQDSARSLIWGANTTTMSITGSGSLQAFSIYGQMAPLQTATAGAFTDPVVATITF
jgi:spore coat protein U-like protein